MSHCYGYNSYSELLDAARKEREEKARQLEIADLKYRIRERENECFKFVIEEILGNASMHITLQEHLERARKKYPNFGGLVCVLNEVVDLIKASEIGTQKDIQKQALHVAVTALRLYEGD